MARTPFLQDRTQGERDADIAYLTKLPLKELRRRQDIVKKERDQAYRLYITAKGKNDGPGMAKADKITESLGAKESDLLEAIDRQQFPENYKDVSLAEKGKEILSKRDMETITKAGEGFKEAVPGIVASMGLGIAATGGDPLGAIAGVPALVIAFENYSSEVLKVVVAAGLKEADVKDLKDAEVKVRKVLSSLRLRAKPNQKRKEKRK